MENKIKEILNKILSNENLLEISLKIDNINDLADFFISQGMEKSSKEYLIKYFTDIYEDKVNILEIVPEDLLLEISGGANKKIVSSVSMILSSLISLNCVSPNVFAEKNTKDSQNRVTKHADKIFGAVGAVVVPLLIYKLFSNINSTNINYKLVTEEYLQDPKTPVSADMWFTNLGGTQTDIENYQQLRSSYNLSNLSKEKKQIELDVPRRSEWIRPFEVLTDKTLIRILSIYHTQSGNIGYAQGYDWTLYMICYKFLSNNITYTPETEAKIYYIYSRIIEIMRNFEDSSTWPSKFDLYAKKFRKQTDVSTQQQLDMLYEDREDVTGNMLALQIIITLGMYSLDIKEAINMWDNILTNPELTSKNTRKLDSDKVLDLINIVGHTKLLNEL